MQTEYVCNEAGHAHMLEMPHEDHLAVDLLPSHNSSGKGGCCTSVDL